MSLGTPENSAIQKLSIIIIKTYRAKMALRLTTDSETQLSARNNSVFLPSWCRKQTNKKLKAQKETQYIYINRKLSLSVAAFVERTTGTACRQLWGKTKT